MFDKLIIISSLSTLGMAMIHDRIRRARVLKGYTLEALPSASATSLEKQALSKFESGQTAPNSTRLLPARQSAGTELPGVFFPCRCSRIGPAQFRKPSKDAEVSARASDRAYPGALGALYIALENCFDHADIDLRSPVGNACRVFD